MNIDNRADREKLVQPAGFIITEIAAALGGGREYDRGVEKLECPVCSYKTLSVFEGDDGRPVVHCYSCSQNRDIRDAPSARGLFPKERGQKIDRGKVIAEAKEVWAAGEPVEGSFGESYFRRRGLPRST
jgi:hypothetical protein